MMDKLSTRQWVALGITVPASLFLLYLLLKKQDEGNYFIEIKKLMQGLRYVA